MNIRNAIYKNTENTIIDVEIDHPIHGWIPYTFKSADVDESADAEIRDYLVTAVIGDYTPPLQAELDAQTAVNLLQAKKEALSSITVTTSNGNTFDGDETARGDMLSVLREADRTGETTTAFWVLADNTLLQPCTYAELEEAHSLAIRRKGEVLAGNI